MAFRENHFQMIVETPWAYQPRMSPGGPPPQYLAHRPDHRVIGPGDADELAQKEDVVAIGLPGVRGWHAVDPSFQDRATALSKAATLSRTFWVSLPKRIGGSPSACPGAT
jgi:hypothetical protein